MIVKTKMSGLFNGLIAALIIGSAMLGAQSKTDGVYVASLDTVFTFVDLVSGGGSASVLSNTDDGVALLTLPFSFHFYGNNYTLVCVSSNGILSFVSSAGACVPSADFANADLTTSAPPGDLPALLPLWADLQFQNAGAVYYQTQGTVGSRQFIVEWSNAYQTDGTNPATFEVILFEGTNQILFQYQTVDFGASAPASKGAQAAVGIRDSSGNVNNREIAWSYNAPVIANNSAILFAPAGYLVGDAFPYTADTIGSFGDGALNTLDLITALRAVTNLQGFLPLSCSDRFDAMDSYPLDGSGDVSILSGRPGGDGLLNTLDLIATLRRVTNIDTSRPTRVARGITCTPDAAPSRKAAAAPAEGSLELGAPIATSSGAWRIPVRLRANVDLDLQGLGFSAGYDSAPSRPQLDFVAAGSQPSVIDRGVPGKIAMAWLEGWHAKAGQVVDLGSVEAFLSADALRLYGVSANAVSGGRAVSISLTQQQRRTR